MVDTREWYPKDRRSKVWILVDNDNIIRCMATHEPNLHDDKRYMKKFFVLDKGFIIGDEFIRETSEVKSRPENHPVLLSDIYEEEIKKKIRINAIKELKKENKLPQSFPEE